MNWQDKARAARTLLAGVAYGGRETTISTVAGDNDINTVRRQVKTVNYLDAVKKASPDIGRDLDHQPFSSLEILARWHDFDRKAAIEAARDLVEGKLTFKSLRSAMLAAKPSKSSSIRKSDFAMMTRANVEAIGGLLGGRITALPSPKRASSLPRHLFHLVRAEAAPETVAAVLVGPYSNPKLYHKRRQDWTWRALGMAWQYDHVVLLLPSSSHLDEYRSWLADVLVETEKANREARPEQGATRLPSVRVLVVEPDDLAPHNR
jgi:hypothetical protein